MSTAPDHDGWVRLHPLSPIASGGRLFVLFLVIAAQNLRQPIGALISEGLLTARVVGAFTAVAAVAFGLSYLSWQARGYRITADRIETRRGVVFRSHRHLPLDRMETVDTVQPLLPRLLGLAEVRVEAVSQGGSELHLSYLTTAGAEALRDELTRLRRVRGGTAESVDSSEPPPSGTLLHVVPTQELALGYVFIPAVYLAPFVVIALGAVVATGDLFVLLSIVVPAFLGIGIPSFSRLDRVWNFRITDLGDSFVVARGLLNLTSQRIITGRVQAVRVDQPLLWRPFKRYRLVVDVAGYRGDRGEDAAAMSTLLPIGDATTVRDLMRRLDFVHDVDAVAYLAVPERARWRAPLRWRSYGLARDGGWIVARSGVLSRRVDLVPVARLQSRRVTQGPWQRRLSLATVHFDTAGSRVRTRAPHRDEAEAFGLLSSRVLVMPDDKDPRHTSPIRWGGP